MAVKRIRAWLPYEVPGIAAVGLSLDIELDKLTILVGPNASGKTAILESIGYMLASHQKSADEALLSLTLTSTLRPNLFIPLNFAVNGEIEGIRTMSLYINADPSLLLERRKLENLTELLSKSLRDEIERDLTYANELIPFYEHARYRPLLTRSEVIRRLIDVIHNIVGENIEISLIARAYSRGARLIPEEDIPRILSRVLRFSRRPPMLIYTIENGDLIKSIVISGMPEYLLIRQRKIKESEIQLAVFHPGFSYWRGMFESLYYARARRGMPNEREAIDVIREYIRWFNGFELLGRTLHVKDYEGVRIPIYSLSDGYRIVVLLGLLYAMTKPPTLFLIDTPEAFVHPDGVPVVADLIARLVKDGNQVVLATQSTEFLEVLLDKAEYYEVIDHASVLRISLTADGQIRDTGRWKGLVAKRSLEELGVDLRR